VRGEREHYPSRIEILDDNCIVLAAPSGEECWSHLGLVIPVKITIQHKDSLYEFETSILGRRSGHIPYLV